MERSAGILLPVFSLPSRYGIGALGGEARKFLDFLQQAGQRWWQVLPVGPVGEGNSPYSGTSAFAGEPLLLDLSLLAEDSLLTEEELRSAEQPEGEQIDYAAVRASREVLLHRAFQRGRERDAEAVRAFAAEHRWVEDYAVYMAAKSYFGGKSWLDWPDEALRRHEGEAVERWRQVLSEEVEYQKYLQYLFHRQWTALRSCAAQRGIRIIGDLPIYVSLDSADVWSERQFFALDAEGHPLKVAGVPPDYFSRDGQLWGNPVYDWEAMRLDGYGWWIRRIGGAAERFDAIRIDHFRGFADYWAVPAGAETAREGTWESGPGMELVKILRDWFRGVEFLAEDLGFPTPRVRELLRASGLPGMRVLEFAFTDPQNTYLPHNQTENSVCYTGTHDNDTLQGWCDGASERELGFAAAYLGVSGRGEICPAILREGHKSVAALFIAQLQDYLGLGTEARINLPGTAEGNWRWRLRGGLLTPELKSGIRALTELYGRCPATDGLDRIDQN